MMKTIAKLSLVLTLLLCLAQQPGSAKTSPFSDSLDTLFGKSEEFLIENYGKAFSERREPEWKDRKYLRYEMPRGSSGTSSANSIPVDVCIIDGKVAWVSVWHYWPGRGPKADLIGSLGEVGRHSTAVGLNFLNDKVSDFGRPAVKALQSRMIKGASDTERWRLVKGNLMRLGSMDEQQVKTIFGQGMRYEIGPKKSYSDFFLSYQITPAKLVPDANCRRCFEMDLWFMGGTVARARIEQSDTPILPVHYKPE